MHSTNNKFRKGNTDPKEEGMFTGCVKILCTILRTGGERGGTVVKLLCYKSEGRWFDSRRCHWNFSLTYPSDRTMALWSTQPLTEMSTRSIFWE
jgi:hypothetical protein